MRRKSHPDLQEDRQPARCSVTFGAYEDGYYRKYGAYKIGGDILPHHLHYGRHWVVKPNAIDKNGGLRDAMMNDELTYVRDNPLRDTIAKVFEIAEVDFGRVDYGVVDGKVTIYEINTNPKLSGFNRSDGRNAIRAITKPQMFDGFEALNTPIATKERFVRFRMPKPRGHRFRWPIKNLSRAAFRLVLS